jgi:hypothetical protein
MKFLYRPSSKRRNFEPEFAEFPLEFFFIIFTICQIVKSASDREFYSLYNARHEFTNSNAHETRKQNFINCRKASDRE